MAMHMAGPTYVHEMPTFLLLHHRPKAARGSEAGQAMVAMPGRELGSLSVLYEPALHRRLKLGLREASQADRLQWAGRKLRLSLVYADDGTPLQSGSSRSSSGRGLRDDPLLHWPVAGMHEGRSVRVAELKMGNGGETIDAFALMASSNAHGKRAFELRIESEDGGPAPRGRLIVYPSFAKLQSAAATGNCKPHAAATAAGAKRARKAWTPAVAAAEPTAEWPQHNVYDSKPPSSEASFQDHGQAEMERELESADGSVGEADSGTREPAETVATLAMVDMLRLTGLRLSDKAVETALPASAAGLVLSFASTQYMYSPSIRPSRSPAASASGPWLDRTRRAPQVSTSLELVHGEETAWRLLPAQLRTKRGPPPVPLQPDPAAVEAALAFFAAANDPSALDLSTPPASERIVAALTDPLLLHTHLLQTLPGRVVFRGALHNLREAGFFHIVGMIMEALATSVLTALPEPSARAEAAALVELCKGLLTAGTSELPFVCPHLALLPWRTAHCLLERLGDVVALWATKDPELLCRALLLRGRTLFAYGYTGAAVEVGFEAWSVAIRSQLSPSRLEAAAIELIVRALFRVGKFNEGIHLADRLYFVEGDGCSEEDRFLKARVLHLRAQIEEVFRRRPRLAMVPATQAVEVLSSLPPAYRPYGSRPRIIRCIYYGTTGRLPSLRREYHASLNDTIENSRGDYWSPCWDMTVDAAFKYLHPPELAAAAARACGPVKNDITRIRIVIVGLGAFERRAEAAGRWLPSGPFALYQLGLAELVGGAADKAERVLEKAGRLLREKCPRHFPSESAPQQAIEAALALARARLAGGPGAPDNADVLGFRARAVSHAELFGMDTS